MSNDAASHDRFRLIVLLVVAGALALASFWLVNVVQRSTQPAASAEKPNEPDYFVENFRLVRIAPDGHPKTVMAGKELVHRPLNDQSDVTQPQALVFNPEQAPLTLQSRNAQIDHPNNRVLLRGGVDMLRSADARGEGWRMQSETLWLLPDDDQLKTDDEVQIVSGKSVLHGRGMLLDNARGQFQLQNSARASFAPPTPAATKTGKAADKSKGKAS